MLQPKRTKFKKSFRGRRTGIAIRGSSIAFGEYGLKSLGEAWLSANQIEAARRATTHELKGNGRVWVRVFPDKPVTARAAGHRMGGGKGDVEKYVSVILPGRIILEVSAAPKDLVTSAFAKASDKLPFKTRMVSREEIK